MTGLFWSTRTCVALGLAVGLLAGLAGLDDHGTADADQARNQEHLVDQPSPMRVPVVGVPYTAWTPE